MSITIPVIQFVESLYFFESNGNEYLKNTTKYF